MATAPLLDLKTITPQNSILIDGISYFLRHADMLTLMQAQILNRAYPRAAALMTKERITEEEDLELSGLLQQACSIVLDAPADVQAALTDQQRSKIFLAFTPLRSRLLVPPTNGANEAAAQSHKTSASGSRASKRTTADRRTGGSTRSRQG
jgi:hypothetical protein